MLRKLCSNVIFNDLLINHYTIEDLNILEHYKEIIKNDFIDIFKEITLGEIEIIGNKLYVSLHR